MAKYIERYVPADTNGGWGYASFVILLVIICIVGATYIHKKTYKHPTDVTWRGVGEGKMGSGDAVR